MKTPLALVMQQSRFTRILFTITVAASFCCGSYLLAQRPADVEQELLEHPVNKYIEDLPEGNPLPGNGSAAVLSRPAFSPTGVQPGVSGPKAWTELGPFGINGQTSGRVDPVSGRTTAIAIHPTNPSIVYVGTAQGGVYRSLNGGTTWTQLMASAPSGITGCPLAIGSVTIDPLPPFNRIYVGTGEVNLSGDSFFGNGLYIITNAD